MTDLPAKLEELQAALTRLGSPIDGYLRPGVPGEEVHAGLRVLGLQPTEELIDWFGWHDGYDVEAFNAARPTRSALEFFPTLEPISLETAIEVCQRQRGIVATLAEDYPVARRDEFRSGYWSDTWFPVLTGPVIHAAECSVDRVVPASPVWRFVPTPGRLTTARVSGSVSELVERMLLEIEAGSVWWHGESQTMQPTAGAELRLEDLGL